MYNNTQPKPDAKIRPFNPIGKSGKEVYEYSNSLPSEEERRKFYDSLRATEKVAFNEYEGKMLLEKADKYIAESNEIIKEFETSFKNILNKTINYISK